MALKKVWMSTSFSGDPARLNEWTFRIRTNVNKEETLPGHEREEALAFRAPVVGRLDQTSNSHSARSGLGNDGED